MEKMKKTLKQENQQMAKFVRESDAALKESQRSDRNGNINQSAYRHGCRSLWKKNTLLRLSAKIGRYAIGNILKMATQQEIDQAIEKIISLLKNDVEEELSLLSIKEAAEILKVDIKTARRFLSNITKVQIGKQFRIKKTDFIEYIKKHETNERHKNG